jgi:hypothetical protein
MSRFAVVHEDPDYIEDENSEMEIMEWLNQNIDGVVVKKPQEDYSPYDTINS